MLRRIVQRSRDIKYSEPKGCHRTGRPIGSFTLPQDRMIDQWSIGGRLVSSSRLTPKCEQMYSGGFHKKAQKASTEVQLQAFTHTRLE